MTCSRFRHHRVHTMDIVVEPSRASSQDFEYTLAENLEDLDLDDYIV
jgi:hypothetical protein